MNRRKRPGKQFFITINFTFAPCLLERARLISNPEVGFNEIISYCVAVERSDKSELCSHHIHCFVEFKEALLISDLCEYLKSVYFELHIDVQPCRSRKSCLKYISKENVYFYTNVKTSDLHFNYRCFKWADSISKFDHTHPFVTLIN